MALKGWVMFRVFFSGLWVWFCCAHFASAATYDFRFDDIDDGMHAAPFVGFGSLSFDGGNPGDGSFPYNSFSNLSLEFQFSAVASDFTEDDAVTPLSEVLLVFSDNGQQLQFGNVNDSGSGEFTGALDFVREDAMRFALSTEPPGIGGNLDRYFLGIVPSQGAPPSDPVHFGNYRGILVPEPNGVAIAMVGLMMICSVFGSRRRQRQNLVGMRSRSTSSGSLAATSESSPALALRQR